jgi:hypothetical protein
LLKKNKVLVFTEYGSGFSEKPTMRKAEKPSAREEAVLRRYRTLIDEIRAVIAGPVRQELLSGISSKVQFELRTTTVLPSLALTRISHALPRI